jgi:uncharacterized protein YbjQ (UPF0145 family)
MRFYRRRGANPNLRADESMHALETGGLPLAARERFAKLTVDSGRSFTSDLSIAEFLLVREAGFRPVSQVMGSCFFQMGWQYMPGKRPPGTYAKEGQATPASQYASGFEYDDFGRKVYSRAAFGQVFELATETNAWREGRRLALARLAEEAKLAAADAVVGVRIRRGVYDWARGLIEFVALGTAVVSSEYDLGNEPVLSNLSGQEFAKLYASGYWPVGISGATAVIYVMSGWQQKLGRGRFAPNHEAEDYTQGIQHAREVALSRLTREARSLGGSGVVGLNLEVSQREHDHEGSRSRRQKDVIVTVHALGTAIVEIRGRERPSPPQSALSLDQE